MEALNISLNAVEWWRLLLVGFLLGVGFTCFAIAMLSLWAGTRRYAPGPFARPFVSGDSFRLVPPQPDEAA